MIKKSIAILFAILFVVTAVTALLLFNFERRAFTAETYQQAFARGDFYNKILALMAQAIVSSSETSELPPVMKSMGAEAWENFFRELLPEDTLKSLGDDALTSTFAYLNMEADSAKVSLAPLKTAMTSEAGTQAALSLIEALPACTVEQIAQITLNLFSSGEIQLCNPPDELTPLLVPIVQGQLQLAAAIIPDELTLIQAPAENDPRQRLQTLRLFLRLSPILPIGFLLALTVLCVRSLNDWLDWWGIPLLITGLLASIMGLLGAPIVGRLIVLLLSKRLPDYLPAYLSDFTGDLASAMVQALLTPVLWQGVVLFLLGLIMAGAGWALKRRRG